MPALPAPTLRQRLDQQDYDFIDLRLGLVLDMRLKPLRHGQVSAAVPTAYDGLYSALKDWGRFELVLTPTDADLVFHVVCPSIKEGHPVLELQILDPKTRIAIWGFSEDADPAELQKNRDTNFERALTRLTQYVRALFARADSLKSQLLSSSG